MSGLQCLETHWNLTLGRGSDRPTQGERIREHGEAAPGQVSLGRTVRGDPSLPEGATCFGDQQAVDPAPRRQAWVGEVGINALLGGQDCTSHTLL